MNDLSLSLYAAELEQIQFDVEQEIGKVLDGLEVATYFLRKGLRPDSVKEVVQHLDAQFLSRFPAFTERIILEATALPPELPLFVRKKQYKVRGEVWTIHQNDVDPFPSSPHAHNHIQNLVMHLGNGKLYRNRNFVAGAKRKCFLDLRSLVKSVALPPLEKN